MCVYIYSDILEVGLGQERLMPHVHEYWLTEIKQADSAGW